MTTARDIVIAGSFDPGFAQVADVFESHFHSGAAIQEVGAALAVFVRGRRVINIWAGLADVASGRRWAEDTIVNIWSTTKAVMAVAIAQLREQGLVSYDAPVARYWPEFAQAGKAGVTVGHVLSHQSGLNGFAARTTPEELGDWKLLTERLARQAPAWEPGTATSYHALTYGYILGEIARRVTGLMPGALVSKSISEPLAAEIFIGLPASRREKVATLIPADSWVVSDQITHPLAAQAMNNPVMDMNHGNASFWRQAEIPGANGHASALGLARMFGALAMGGTLDDVRLLSEVSVDGMRAPRSDNDLRLGAGAWGAGVMINRGGMFGPGPRAYGHCGWGGIYGYTDPDFALGVGYTQNRMSPNSLQDPRAMALARAIAKCCEHADT